MKELYSHMYMIGRYPVFVIRIVLPLLALMMIPTCLDAQDSTRVSNAASVGDSSMLRIGVTVGQYYQPGDPGEFNAPSWLQVRRRHNRKAQSLWSLDSFAIPDLPMTHGAGYAAVRFDIRPLHGISASVELVGEHRGMSYGIFNSDNLIVYPLYSITADTAIRIGGERIGIRADAGHFTDLRLQEGLTMYNIDGEGADVQIAWRSLRLRHTRIGDISFGTGLDIDEVYDWIVGVENIPLTDDIRLNAHAGIYEYKSISRFSSVTKTPRSRLIDSVDLRDNGFTADLSLALDSVRFYTQGALRLAGSSRYLSSRTAFIAGLSGSFRFGAVNVAGRGEYRYYGGLFNHGYRSEAVYYRDTARIDYGNSLGSQIYPIRYYDRPFSQWAVFTEYQNLRAVNALTLYTTATWRFFDDFFLRLMVDANHLMMEGEDPHLYFFYDTGIGWEPAPGTFLMLSHTNKAMNLDKHYMTFYQKKRGGMMYTLRVEF